MNWRLYPILRITVFFVAGVIVGKLYPTSPLMPLFTIGLLICYGIWADGREGLSDRVALLLSSSLLLAGFLAGFTRVQLQNVSNDYYHYQSHLTEHNQVLATVLEDIKQKASLKTTVRVDYINGQPSRGKLLVYFPVEDDVTHIKPGCSISFASSILPARANSNPLAFDYKAYLINRGVNYQSYLRTGTYKLEHVGKLPWVLQYTYDLRNEALDILAERLHTKEQLATASAMILGYRDHISEDLYNAYATTGSVHVLAVSGLHVGIICWIFIALFSKIKDERLPVRTTKAVFLILLVWFYAILTGAAPAVVRASVMFTIMIIGKYWFDGQNIYNTLAFSCLILLMYDPLLLFQASFQFSYLALLGIVFFHKLWYTLVDFRYLLLDKLWNLLVVAAAAQSLVFPVTIYYFHKFPLYFLVSGVVSVTLAFAILINGILVILLSSVPVVGEILAYTLRAILDLFIGIVYAIRDLPSSNLSGLWFSTEATIMIYIGLLLFMLWQYHKKMLILPYGIAMVAVCLTVNNVIFHHNTAAQSQLIVYDVSRGTLVDLFVGNKTYSTRSSDLSKSTEVFAADNYRISRRIMELVPLGPAMSIDGSLLNGVMQYHDLLLYIPSLADDPSCYPTGIDILLLSHSYSTNEHSSMLDIVSPKLVVIDKSIKWRDKEEWKASALDLAVFVHDIREHGALVANRDLQRYGLVTD